MTTLIAKRVKTAFASLGASRTTDEGVCVTTQCLYPSFERVEIFVVGFGAGYKIHDGGGAARNGWMHGGQPGAIRRCLNHQACTYKLAVIDDTLVGEAASEDWLPAAILAVANASAAAAAKAVEELGTAQSGHLHERIRHVLKEIAPDNRVLDDYVVTGASGKDHRFDFAIRSERQDLLLVDGVTPHYLSVVSAYAAFADTREVVPGVLGRFAVFERPLEPADMSLLQQVVDLVPLSSLTRGLRRQLAA